MLILQKNQKFIVSPFHFVAYDKYQSSKNHRTTPLTPRDDSMIDCMIWRTIREYVDRVDYRVNAQMALMRLGMLLHTFADTYAHQLFSGFNSWVNEVKVTRVVNNITGKDITETALADIAAVGEDSVIPPAGHAQAGNMPDLTHISFEMDYKLDENGSHTMKHRRSNTDTFVDVVRHITIIWASAALVLMFPMWNGNQ